MPGGIYSFIQEVVWRVGGIVGEGKNVLEIHVWCNFSLNMCYIYLSQDWELDSIHNYAVAICLLSDLPFSLDINMPETGKDVYSVKL